MPFFRGCRPKPPEVVTFVDLAGAPAPAPAPADEPDETPAPELKPEPKPEPKPKPKPELEKKPSFKPAVTNAPPKKAETNAPPKKVEPKKAAVTNAPPKKVELKKAETNAPPKAKTLEERLKEVRQGGKPVSVAGKSSAPARPQLDLSGLRAELNKASTGSGSGTAASGTGSGAGGGMRGPFDDYYDSIKQRMYAVWQQPVGAPLGASATAMIRVERDGRVSAKSISRRSGNAQFDQSVQNALNATFQLPPPPPDLPDRNITVEFVLSN